MTYLISFSLCLILWNVHKNKFLLTLYVITAIKCLSLSILFFSAKFIKLKKKNSLSRTETAKLSFFCSGTSIFTTTHPHSSSFNSPANIWHHSCSSAICVCWLLIWIQFEKGNNSQLHSPAAQLTWSLSQVGKLHIWLLQSAMTGDSFLKCYQYINYYHITISTITVSVYVVTIQQITCQSELSQLVFD